MTINLRSLGDLSRCYQRPELRGGAWTLADQGLTSLCNFATMVLLARALGVDAFGEFVLLYTVLLFANTLQMALFTSAHNVQAASLEGEAYRSYTATSLLAQTAFAGVLALVLLHVALVAFLLGLSIAYLMVPLAAALFAWQLQEAMRRIHYTSRRADLAFGLDVISYAGQAGLILLMWELGVLSGAAALYAIAVSSGLSALLGFRQLRGSIGTLDPEILGEKWRFGRWLLGESVGMWLSNQAYPVLAAAIVSVGSAGVLRAVQNLIAPSHVLMNAYLAYSLPRASALYQERGKAAMLRYLLPISVGTTAALTVLWCGLGLFSEQLMRLFYAGEFSGHSTLVWLTVVAYFTQFISQQQSVVLMAVQNTRAIFYGRLAAIAITFTGGIWLIHQFGVEGAVMGAALSSLTLSSYLAFAIVKLGEGEKAQENLHGRLVGAGGEI